MTKTRDTINNWQSQEEKLKTYTHRLHENETGKINEVQLKQYLKQKRKKNLHKKAESQCLRFRTPKLQKLAQMSGTGKPKQIGN